MRSISPFRYRFVPLNSMCSRKCDFPVWPSSSLREPTLYQIMAATMGLSLSSLVSTVSPLARTVFLTPRVMNDRASVSAVTTGIVMSPLNGRDVDPVPSSLPPDSLPIDAQRLDRRDEKY